MGKILSFFFSYMRKKTAGSFLYFWFENFHFLAQKPYFLGKSKKTQWICHCLFKATIFQKSLKLLAGTHTKKQPFRNEHVFILQCCRLKKFLCIQYSMMCVYCMSWSGIVLLNWCRVKRWSSSALKIMRKILFRRFGHMVCICIWNEDETHNKTQMSSHANWPFIMWN